MGKECLRRETDTLIRLHILVEGQTEETFVNTVLGPSLAERMVFADTHRITTGRKRGRRFRGGLVSWQHVARDLELWMKEDHGQDSWFTTLFDYYALPDDFPGYATLPTIGAANRIARLEAAMENDIAERLRGYPTAGQFIPYIQQHEFEALLFSDPSAFAIAMPGEPSIVGQLMQIRARFGNPEDIDNGPETAPSKRIAALWPAYQKPIDGLLVAQQIGLPVMRRECPGFHRWVTKLEALSPRTY